MPANTTAEIAQGIADDARELLGTLTAKASTNDNATQAQINALRALIERAERALEEGRQRAQQQRKDRIAELEKLIQSLDSTLATPGLPKSVRDNVRALRRRRRAQLTRLLAREATDFAGVLTPQQLEDIESLLKKAKADVAQKKKAAAFIDTVMRVADLALGIATKAVAAM